MAPEKEIIADQVAEIQKLTEKKVDFERKNYLEKKILKRKRVNLRILILKSKNFRI